MVYSWTVDDREVKGSNQGRNVVRDFNSTCTPTQLSYNEYNMKYFQWNRRR